MGSHSSRFDFLEQYIGEAIGGGHQKGVLRKPARLFCHEIERQHYAQSDACEHPEENHHSPHHAEVQASVEASSVLHCIVICICRLHEEWDRVHCQPFPRVRRGVRSICKRQAGWTHSKNPVGENRPLGAYQQTSSAPATACRSRHRRPHRRPPSCLRTCAGTCAPGGLGWIRVELGWIRGPPAGGPEVLKQPPGSALMVPAQRNKGYGAQGSAGPLLTGLRARRNCRAAKKAHTRKARPYRTRWSSRLRVTVCHPRVCHAPAAILAWLRLPPSAPSLPSRASAHAFQRPSLSTMVYQPRHSLSLAARKGEVRGQERETWWRDFANLRQESYNY